MGLSTTRDSTPEVTMNRIAIVGAGKIGQMIADLLGHCGDYQVAIIDKSTQALDRLQLGPEVERIAIDVGDVQAVTRALRGRYAVLSAAPFHVTGKIAEAAAAAGVHYLDLTEDVANTRRVRELARDAQTAFIPQCGLAPGFITIVGYDLAKHFDSLQDVRLRVGALPQYPSNALNYNLTWSTDGVINEYCEPCEEISMASPTRRSTPAAASARCARRSRAACRISTTARSATRAMPPS
jgi:saccharopine dehydrogenase-like NADP-dependent oxidoreductase